MHWPRLRVLRRAIRRVPRLRCEFRVEARTRIQAKSRQVLWPSKGHHDEVEIQMKTTEQVVKDLASYLDMIGKPEADITVRTTRQTLRKAFGKKAPRGADLYCGQHKLSAVKPDQILPHQPDLLQRETA